MLNDKNNKYFIGLDIGTNSVGFAVTDTSYNVIKKYRKHLIGIRLFEEGNTAQERRLFRSIRRRMDRNKQRIKILRGLFNEEICKVDSAFFQRLDESMYHFDDKTINQTNTIFNDIGFKDKDYHKNYPTIYHLRKALIKGEVSDIRLLYLGIAHIIKNRGHFLFEGQDFSDFSDFKIIYDTLENFILDNEEYQEMQLNIKDTEKFEEILKNKNKNMTLKEKEIKQLLDGKTTKKKDSLIKLICGKKVKLSDLFTNIDEELENKSISFKVNFEKDYAEISNKLDDEIIFIDLVKAIYDWSILCDILDCPQKDLSQVTISDAKIHKFNIYKQELKILKEMIKTYMPNEYKEIFEDVFVLNDKAKKSNLHNYVAYTGMTKIKGEKQAVKNCSQEDFCNYLSKKFEGITIDNEQHIQILEKIKNNTLLQKQRIKDNAVIPYQIHKDELYLILKNNKGNFQFLNNSDGKYTIEDKIKSIFKYRIPYYVGPINNNPLKGETEHRYAWVVKKDCSEKIYPWNFKEVINFEESAERFIRKMTNKCTYLNDCDVIPKQSLLYSKYTVLNELNNIKLNGEPISVELKQEIYENLFKNNKKVTQKLFKAYLVKYGYADKDVVITGIDKDFKFSLESFINFTNIFGQNFDENMAEDIIKWIVLFSQDKEMLKRKINSTYNLKEDELKKVLNLKFSGWGNFSKEFLTEIQVEQNNGEYLNIINALYNTNLNLMKLLSKDYEYYNLIEKRKNKKQLDTITLDDVKALYCSPAVKKSIWQAVRIVKEIEKIMGGSPKKLFIEVTRAKGENKETTSRKKDLEAKYKKLGKEYSDIISELKSKEEYNLRQKKLYLYFTQLGRCAYTGQVINIDDLSNQNLYDIEHIYPRSKTKDDSIHNNLVLVDKVKNSDKGDTYPVPKQYRQEALWKLWLEKGLINRTKYDRLMRTDKFEESELKGFIARQLVETSQASKAVATLFKNYYENKENSKVVYVKAGNVSDFRHHFKIVKVREINDYHHAHDAYLNIIVGNVWDTKFTSNFYKNLKNEKYNLKPEKLYGYDVKIGDKYAWEKDKTIGLVKNVIENSKILFTRQSFEASGQLFDQTIYKKGEGEMAIKNPLNINSQKYKLTNLSKYGGYKKIKGAYFCIVEYMQKKELQRTIEYVPIYLAKQIEKDEKQLERYLEQNLGTKDFKIILRKLKIGSLLNVNGFPMHISARTGNSIIFRGAVQLKLSTYDLKYFKKITKFVERQKQNQNAKIDSVHKSTKEKEEQIKITKEKNLEYYEFFEKKLYESIYSKVNLAGYSKQLLDKKDNFKDLSLEEQSIFLNNILTLFKCNATSADLRLIGATENAGVIKINKKISSEKSVKLINQSITGVFENSIDLLK